MDFHYLSQRDNQFVNEFSDFVNGGMCSCRKVGIAMTECHRYLVNEEFKVVLSFLEALGRKYHQGRYDDRNANACRRAAMMFEYLVEKDEAYMPADYYEKEGEV